MEENREPLSAIAIEKKLQLLRNKHFSEDTIALVKSDYEYGLKEEEISLYLNKSYDIEQMKILSECLHKDVPKDMIDIIKNTKYSVHQMQVSLEFYEKGVPVQTIKEVMDKGEKPITMRRLYEEVLEQLNKVKKQIPEESEYVKALMFAMEKKAISVDQVKENFSINGEQAESVIRQLETIGVLGSKNEDGTHTVMMDKDAFINRVRGYQDLAERMRAVAASKNANLSDVTISKKLIIEENDHAVKTRVPGTWGEEAKYVWLRKENIMEIHGGKTMLTFLDSTKDYKLYDEQNRVVTTQKGTELYTHYDKVESSVRERYEKVQKQQKKTAQKKTVTTKKAR